MDVGGNDVGAFHDNSGNRAFLRRHEPQEKRALRFGADNRYLLRADIGVVCCGLLSGVFAR